MYQLFNDRDSRRFSLQNCAVGATNRRVRRIINQTKQFRSVQWNVLVVFLVLSLLFQGEKCPVCRLSLTLVGCSSLPVLPERGLHYATQPKHMGEFRPSPNSR